MLEAAAMRRLIKVLSMLCCLAVTLTVFELSSVAEGSAQFAFVNKSRAALYSASSMTSRSRYVYKYEIVYVQTTDNVKARVSYKNKEYYIYLKDISILASPLNETAVINRNAKVYAKPSTSSSRTSVSKGMVVNVLAVNGSWALIENSGVAAYIQLAYLNAPSAQPASTPSPVTAGKDSYTLGQGAISSDFEAVVNTSSISVYAKASASSSKLGTLKKGTMVHVYAYDKTWAYIELSGHYGYCKRAYLKVAPQATPTPSPMPSPSSEDVLCGLTACEPFSASTNAKVKVYDKPDAKAVYLGYISKETELTILAYDSKWAYIDLGGRRGFTQRSGLKQSVTATPTPSPIPTASPTPTQTPKPTPEPVYVSSDPIFTNASTTNEQKIYEYLTSCTVYNEAVACGILANIKQESNFNPKSGMNSNYQGLCQWSTTRFAILKTWCEQKGFDPYSLEGQVKFLYYDLSQRYTLYHKALIAIENSSEGAYEAGYYFCYHYERPASLESSSVKRGTNARDVYWNKYAH